MRDFEPATRRLAELLGRVDDAQLTAATPCEKYQLGDLVDHIGRLAVAFAAAARKDLGPLTNQTPSGDGSRLTVGWRAEVSDNLAALAEAWRDPAAWEGMTQVGGIDLPAEICGTVGLGEVTIHGWDVARATGQPFDADQDALDACMAYVSMMGGQDGGPFGPAVDVPEGASPLDRMIGLSGRDPGWTSAG